MDICRRLRSLGRSLFVFLGVVVLTYTVTLAQIDPARAVDFGVVGVDFKVYHTFTYTNPTNKSVTIRPKNVPCECSTVRIEDSVVAPGGSTAVRLEYDTKNVFGRTAKEFTLSTSDPANPVLEYYYASNVGQWILGIKPEPPSAFFLPAHKSKKIALANPRANNLKIALFDQADSYFEVKLLKGSVSKGESAEIEIAPLTSLTKGTYYSSFRLLVTPSEGASPYYLSIPVKIVRY